MASSNPTPSEPSQDDSLKASIFQRLHPRAYLERFLSEGFRPDGRPISSPSSSSSPEDPSEFREVNVNVGSIQTANGSALVRVGNTTVVCGVKAEIAEPELDEGDKGFLVPNIDLPALCSPKFKPGPPSDEAQVLSERLNEVLVSSNILPLQSLCIEPKKSVWTLYVDAICINYDGNAFDAALIAMVLALKNTRLPKARYEEHSGLTLCSRKESEKIPLIIETTPFAMTFGVFDGTHILSDPSAFEEPLLDDTLTIVMDQNGDFISVSHIGEGLQGKNGSSKEDVVQLCMQKAKTRYQEAFSTVFGP
ncbi:ribosomal protein S5 domain 2-type protein [Coprinopsis sp. MPI-PUGE-AT-0042]|nr:ribosomal protein S5 domain 2-type protein [Coprinopsis sp. MPI-PUGE-AT-0042]